jgi:MFS family permease
LPAPTRREGESISAAIRDGARYARREPGIRAVMSYLALNSLFAAPFIALVPAMALTVFHEEESGTAALVTAQGVGAVSMALMLGGLAHRFGHRHVLLAALGALPVVLVGYALAPTLPVAVVAIFFVGAAYLCCLSSFTTVAQRRAPNELRGRVRSALMVLLGVLYPIGSIVQGWIADGIGLRATTAGAALLLGAALLAIKLLRPHFDTEVRDPPVVVPADSPSGVRLDASEREHAGGDEHERDRHLPAPPESEVMVSGGRARDRRRDEQPGGRE